MNMDTPNVRFRFPDKQMPNTAFAFSTVDVSCVCQSPGQSRNICSIVKAHHNIDDRLCSQAGHRSAAGMFNDDIKTCADFANRSTDFQTDPCPFRVVVGNTNSLSFQSNHYVPL